MNKLEINEIAYTIKPTLLNIGLKEGAINAMIRAATKSGRLCFLSPDYYATLNPNEIEASIKRFTSNFGPKSARRVKKAVGKVIPLPERFS